MKKISDLLVLFAALSLLSCEQPEAHDEMVKVTFTGITGVHTRTAYADGAILWEASDRISLLSGADYSVKTELTMTSLSEDRTTARFEGLASNASGAYIAVYPSADGNVYSGGKLSVCIPSVQTGMADGFASGSNVSVASVGKDTDILQFKNVSSLISFRFRTQEEASEIKSVTFKAKKSDGVFWGLSGNVSVSLSGDNIPEVSEGDAEYVTVSAPEGGFAVDCAYYIPVCPVGECKGLQLIFTDRNGQQTVRNNDTPCVLERSRIIDLDYLPQSGDADQSFGNEGFGKALIRVGIMGDSISTFAGELVNSDYKCHYPCEEDEVSKVEQTWWWQLIYEKMDNGVLDVNNSFSGTKVSHGSYTGRSNASYQAGFVDRVGQFHAPDVIIIHGGTNDCLKDTDKENIGDYQWDTPLDQMDLTKFRSSYVYLVRKLQELYDGVQLILIVGDRLGADKDLKYDDTIIEIAKHFDLPYVDLTPHRKVDIPVPDNCHPNYVGHAFIAQKVYDTCKDYLK